MTWENESENGQERYTWEEYEVIREPGETLYMAVHDGGYLLKENFSTVESAKIACEKHSPHQGPTYEYGV